MTMMKCGHAANATIDGKRACVLCVNIRAGWDEVSVEEPDLSGRAARCSYCKHSTVSSVSLPFFEHKPKHKYDAYYCGCRGWD
jgi:hypothetical protein